MADLVEPDEQLSRFLLDKGHFTPDYVKFRAFLPPRGAIILSVLRTDDLAEEEIWGLGEEHVAAGTRTIFARADFLCAVLAEINAGDYSLSAVPDEPPARHANVTGWPPIEQKELQKQLAQQMAARCGRPRQRPEQPL